MFSSPRTKADCLLLRLSKWGGGCILWCQSFQGNVYVEEFNVMFVMYECDGLQFKCVVVREGSGSLWCCGVGERQ